jgi:translation initiation factor 2 alpha subunit (eIF-2alpha)
MREVTQKRENVFTQNMSVAPGGSLGNLHLTEVIETTSRAEIGIAAEAHQSQAVMEAIKRKTMCAQRNLRQVQVNAQAEYARAIDGIEAYAAPNRRGERAQGLIEDFAEYLEVQSGQHHLGQVEVAALMLAQELARHVVTRKKGWWIFGG